MGNKSNKAQRENSEDSDRDYDDDFGDVPKIYDASRDMQAGRSQLPRGYPGLDPLHHNGFSFPPQTVMPARGEPQTYAALPGAGYDYYGTAAQLQPTASIPALRPGLSMSYNGGYESFGSASPPQHPLTVMPAGMPGLSQLPASRLQPSETMATMPPDHAQGPERHSHHDERHNQHASRHSHHEERHNQHASRPSHHGERHSRREQHPEHHHHAPHDGVTGLFSSLQNMFGAHVKEHQQGHQHHHHHAHHDHTGELKHHYFGHVHQPRSHALPLEGVRVLEVARRTWSSALCGQMLAASGAEVVRVAFGEEAEALRNWGHTREGDVSARAVQSEADAARILERARVHPVVPPALHVGKRLAPHRPDIPIELQELKRDLVPGADVFLTDLTVDELDNMGLGYPAIRERFPHIIYVHTASIGARADLSQKGVEDAGSFYCLTGIAESLGHYLGPRGLAASTAASSLFGVVCIAVMRRRCGCPADRLELSIFRAGKWSATLGVVTDWVQPPRAHDNHEKNNQLEEDIEKAPPFPFNVFGAAHVTPGHDTHHHSHDARRPNENFNWRDRRQDLELPPPLQFNPVTSELPLSRVSVIEISDEYLISAAAVGRMLVDLGAQVTKVERPSRPDPWKSKCPELWEALNRHKTIDEVDYGGVLGGEAALYRALASATMLVTNLPLRAMDAWGLNLDRLREMFPHLIIVLITTWGCDKIGREHEHRDGRKGGEEVHAFWEATGLSRCFQDAKMPPGLSELSVAQCVLAGVGLALLRQQRTNTGQLVHVSRYHAGFFCRLISEADKPEPGASPLLQTQDGRFLRLLGRGHHPHDVWMLLHALGSRKKEELAPKSRNNKSAPRQASNASSKSWWDTWYPHDNKHESFMPRAQRNEGLSGFFHHVVEYFEGWTWADIQHHQKELLDCARQWRYDALAHKFNEKGIDWFVEELRPGQTEAQHRLRAADVEHLQMAHAEAENTLRRWIEQAQRLEYHAQLLPPPVRPEPTRHQHHHDRQKSSEDVIDDRHSDATQDAGVAQNSSFLSGFFSSQGSSDQATLVSGSHPDTAQHEEKHKEKKKKHSKHKHDDQPSPEEQAAMERYNQAIADRQIMANQIQEAYDNQERCKQQLAVTAHQLDLAEEGLKWLKWRDGLPNNELAPWSVEDKSWVEACGGKLMLRMPVTLSSMNNQASIEKPHHVALFPQLYDHVPKVTVTIKSAQKLKSDPRPENRPRAYVICEIPGKPHSRFKTRTARESSSPEWNEKPQEVADFEIGNSLSFSVFAVNPSAGLSPGASVQITGLETLQTYNGQMGTCMEYDPLSNSWAVRIGDQQFKVKPENLIPADATANDAFLGWVAVNSKKFFPNGFDGILNLNHTGGFESTLRILIEIKGNYGTILRGSSYVQ